MRFFFICLGLSWRTPPTWANVEKTIFLTPSVVSTTAHINVAALDLDVLSPSKTIIHRRLPATFANSTNPLGTTTWLLLENLVEQQRYEVRVCWAATQPTSFTLHTFDIDQVSKLPDFISSFPAIAESSQSSSGPQEESEINKHSQSSSKKLQDPATDPQSPLRRTVASAKVDSIRLFLQVSAAADYFTTDIKLMRNVPPVHVDIILDPYLFNIFPASLLPTAIYLIIIAIGAWFLSDQIWLALHNFAQSDETPKPASDPTEATTPAKKDI